MKSKGQPRLTFFGGAKTVTGSKFLFEKGKKRLLLDCGLFQGRKELRLLNWEEPPFDPRQLDAVVLTHAHIDHSGYLPLLVRRGFSGPVYCSTATKELLALVLPDSAHLQEEEASFANRQGYSKHSPAKPLYTVQDSYAALNLLQVFDFHQPSEVVPGIEVRAARAGHILGSSIINLYCDGASITFSGDVGRFDAPILPDPEPVELGDLLVCESTYGGELHEDHDVAQELAEVVNQAAERNAPLLIPAFAIGRTQTLLYYLSALEHEKKIPVLPVYIDSPMAQAATKIYHRFEDEYDTETIRLVRDGKNPLVTGDLRFCRTVEESKRLNNLSGTRIIIAASGMINGGRVLHHAMRLFPDPRAIVLLVSYQAEGTRGAFLQQGAKEIRMFGTMIPVRASIASISGFSAHADQSELLRWLRSCSGKPKQARVVHGEEDSAESFARLLRKDLQLNASAASPCETVAIS